MPVDISPASPATRPSMRPARSIRRGSVPASRPSRTAICISVMPRASALISVWRAITAVSAICASTTPILKKKIRNMSMRSRRWSLGWAGAGRPNQPAPVPRICSLPAIISTSCTAPPNTWSAPAWLMSMSKPPRKCALIAATSPRPASTAHSAAAARRTIWPACARCATACMPTARWCCAPRSTWLRRISICATRRCTASAAPPTTTRATNGASTRCTPLRIRSKTRSSASRTASAHSSSRINGRSMTGC